MGSPQDKASPILNAQCHSRRISKTRKSNGDHRQLEGSHPSDMKSGLSDVFEPDPTKAEATCEDVVEPVRLHIRLNHRNKKSAKKEKKRSKYICRKCNIPRFGGRLLFRQHLLSHIDRTRVAVTLNRLRLPEKVVVRASRYYARKHPTVTVSSDPVDSCVTNEVASVNPEVVSDANSLPEVTQPGTPKVVNVHHLPNIGKPCKTLPSNNCVLKRILEHGESSYSVCSLSLSKSVDSETVPRITDNQKSNLDNMANSTCVKQTLPISSESSEDSRGKELMEELGIQMNKLAGSFFRNDMQSSSGMHSSQPLEHSFPPPLVADCRSSGETSQHYSHAVHSSMNHQTSVQQNRLALSPNVHSQQSVAPSGAPSPSIALRLSPHMSSTTTPTMAAYRTPSPQTNGLSVASPRMSPHMTPPLVQRSSPHLQSHMQNLGNTPHESPLSSTPPSSMTSQAFSMSAVSSLPSGAPVVMTSSNVPNERCESVMIIEKPQSSTSNMRQNIGSRTSHSQPMNSAAFSMTSASSSQCNTGTSAAPRNPLALLRQLDPAKSMPTNISLQATNSLEDHSRPASVMILENPRDNPTPKFNIGNIVSLAPGYCNQLYGNAPASSFAPTPSAMPHLLQDISSNCSCNTCTDIRSGDLIRRAQIMIQAGHYEYKCPMCIRRFAHKSSLLRHTRSFNHGFVCDLCSSGFLGQSAFECHKRLHQEKSIILPTAGGHNQLLASAVSHQQAKQHNQQAMNPPPPPLLSSMNRRLVMNNTNTNRDINSNATMIRQKQLVQQRSEGNSMMQFNNRNVVDDDVIVVGIERRQTVSRPMGRALPPPPPLERAPRPNFPAASNRQMQERISMIAQSANSNVMSRNVNQMPQRGGNVKTAAAPLPPQSQLARIFNNSEITLTPIGNEGNARKLAGITITPTSQSNTRHPQTGNSNIMAMNMGSQIMRPRVQFSPRTNVNNFQRFQTPVISNVRHVGPAQTRSAPMPNMNQGFVSNRQMFAPQIQSSRMPTRNIVPARSNQSTNILNNEYISQLSTAMQQTAHAMNNNSGNRSMMASRSDTGTHTSYRMMPVANPVGLQQSNPQPKQMPTWHHPVSTEAYGSMSIVSKNSNIHNQTLTGATNPSIAQSNVRPIQAMHSSSVLPSSCHSSGPNRFPISVQQVQVPAIRQMQAGCPQNGSSFIAQSSRGLSSAPSNAQNQSNQGNLTKVAPNLNLQTNCPFCTMKFNSSSEFQDHYRQKHNGNVQTNKPACIVKCPKCQAQFSDMSLLKKHELACQEQIPCIRCNLLIRQEKWADHCSEFHTSENQNNLSSITLTNPFENNSEANGHAPFTTKENTGSLMETSTNIIDTLVANKESSTSSETNQRDLHSSTTSQQEHTIPTSELNYPDDGKSSNGDSQHNGLNSQECNTDAPTDDDVLVHDLSVAAASEIQLINDTVKDIADSGGTKISISEMDSKNDSLAEEDEQTNVHDSEFPHTDFNNVSDKSEMQNSDESTGNGIVNPDNMLPPSANEELGQDESGKPPDELHYKVTSPSSPATETSGSPPAPNSDISMNCINNDRNILDSNEKALDDYSDHPEPVETTVTTKDVQESDLVNEDCDVECSVDPRLRNLENEPQFRLSLGLDDDGDKTVEDGFPNSSDVGDGKSFGECDSNEIVADCSLDDNFPISDNDTNICVTSSSQIQENVSLELMNRAGDDNVGDVEHSELMNCAVDGDVGDEEHSGQEDGQEKTDLPAGIEEDKGFLCPICDQVSSTKKEFLNHITIHQSPQTCHLCNNTFNSRKKLVLHLRSHMKSCSKARRSTFSSPTLASKRPRRDSGSSAVGIAGSTNRSNLMVALLDVNKVAANVGFLQRMGVVGLISLNDLQQHVGAGTLLNDGSDDLSAIPIVNLTSD